MPEYVLIRGAHCDDDGLAIPLPAPCWEAAQSGVCPDCGGHWQHAEAGSTPGARRCMGPPLAGPLNPILDRRVPLAYDPDVPRELSQSIVALYLQRNVCQEREIPAIDNEIVALLSPYCRPPLTYSTAGGCGSLFVIEQGEQVWRLRRLQHV